MPHDSGQSVLCEDKDVRVAVESFRPHWRRIVERLTAVQRGDGGDGVVFYQTLHLSKAEYGSIVRAMNRNGDVRDTIPFNLCDRVLTAAGRPDLTAELYLVDRSGESLARSLEKLERAAAAVASGTSAKRASEETGAYYAWVKRIVAESKQSPSLASA